MFYSDVYFTLCRCCCCCYFHVCMLLCRTLVPARTVVGVRPATAAEVSTAGLQGHRGGGGSGGSTLVMEFSSALNARLVRSSIFIDVKIHLEILNVVCDITKLLC